MQHETEDPRARYTSSRYMPVKRHSSDILCISVLYFVLANTHVQTFGDMRGTIHVPQVRRTNASEIRHKRRKGNRLRYLTNRHGAAAYLYVTWNRGFHFTLAPSHPQPSKELPCVGR